MEQVETPKEIVPEDPPGEPVPKFEWTEPVTNSAQVLYDRACEEDVQAQILFLDRALAQRDREALDSPPEPVYTTEDILACLLGLISGEEQAGGGDRHTDQGEEQEDQDEPAGGYTRTRAG